MLASVDARTKLAGSNKMEILLFSLGTRETFGINVFKVREVSQTPTITKTPNMPFGVEGVLSLRGNIIPVISLAKFIGHDHGGSKFDTMIVTEFNKSTQAFLVDSVDRIIASTGTRCGRRRTSCGRRHQPEPDHRGDRAGKRQAGLHPRRRTDSGQRGRRTPPADVPTAQLETDQYIFFVDDSVVARKEITGVLEKMGIKFQQATNGREAWDRLQVLAGRNWADGECLHDYLKIILVDAEMPEMDGYVLTKLIKSDQRFKGIPVIMHSSLSSNANRAMGSSVGVDSYVAKFDPGVLAETLIPFLQR